MTKPAWLKKALVRYSDCLASHSSRLRKLSFQLMVAANFLGSAGLESVTCVGVRGRLDEACAMAENTREHTRSDDLLMIDMLEALKMK